MPAFRREPFRAIGRIPNRPGEMACGSKELDSPPFPFPPPGASRGGAGSPHAAGRLRAGAGGDPQARVPAAAPARIPPPAPPTRGVSKRFAETPLVHPPFTRKFYGLAAQGKICLFFHRDDTGLLVDSRPFRPIGGKANQDFGLTVEKGEKRLHKKLDTTA
jgi:hypothetical protein